jgi:hypothetical protein
VLACLEEVIGPVTDVVPNRDALAGLDSYRGDLDTFFVVTPIAGLPR